jgi:acyl-coenzyme A synthetase/AMP-(fatty) acid ligase
MNAFDFLLGPQALARHGDRIALACGEANVTYRVLAESARRASGALGTLGVQPGDRVLLLMRDTPEFVSAWLGTVRAGAVAVPVNSKLSELEQRHIVADSGARLAIVEDIYADALSRLGDPIAKVGLVVVGEGHGHLRQWRDVVHDATEPAAFEARPHSPAFILYSSGTTGKPKGIVHSHSSVTHVGQALRMLGIGPSDRVFTTSRFFFAYGLEHGLLGAMSVGAAAVLSPDWPDRDTLGHIVALHRPTSMFSVPTVYRRLLSERALLEPFKSVRHFVAGGERLSPQLVSQWRAATGGELLNLYGMSETFCACIVTPPGTSDGVRTGAPLPGVELRLEDLHAQEPVPGKPGVLWVRHPAQATEYANLPDQTRAQFKDGWFCTRDVFVRDSEGFFAHQGRSDELVKVAGQWVQPAELEEAVAGEHAINEVACVAVPDEDGLERLALFIAVRGDSGEALRAAAEACERLLPRHKRPKWIRAVEELPRTATGKVQRYKLREMLESERSGKG